MGESKRQRGGEGKGGDGKSSRPQRRALLTFGAKEPQRRGEGVAVAAICIPGVARAPPPPPPARHLPGPHVYGE